MQTNASQLIRNDGVAFRNLLPSQKTEADCVRASLDTACVLIILHCLKSNFPSQLIFAACVDVAELATLKEVYGSHSVGLGSTIEEGSITTDTLTVLVYYLIFI